MLHPLLGEQTQAITVPPDNLDPVASPAAKDKELPGKWILGELRLHKTGEAIETVTQIREPAREPNARPTSAVQSSGCRQHLAQHPAIDNPAHPNEPVRQINLDRAAHGKRVHMNRSKPCPLCPALRYRTRLGVPTTLRRQQVRVEPETLSDLLIEAPATRLARQSAGVVVPSIYRAAARLLVPSGTICFGSCIASLRRAATAARELGSIVKSKSRTAQAGRLRLLPGSCDLSYSSYSPVCRVSESMA